MNKELRELFDRYNIIVKKITIKRGVKIVETSDMKYVIKKKNRKIGSLYRYLSSRNFNSFPSILFNSDNYDVFEYIDGVNIPYEEASVDIIKLVSVLHSKTTFYKDVDDDSCKKIYESVVDKINYLYNYYDDYANVIDEEEYMSPSNYLFVRNISMLFKVLNYCRDAIERWYNIIKDKGRIRVVNLHNNLSLEHYLLSDKPYFISWDKSKRDMPIYDIIIFYKKYYNDFDFCELIRIYESYYPLLKEEKILLLCLISLPDKLDFDMNEYDMCIKVNDFYEYLSNSMKLVSDSKDVDNSKK